MMRTVILVLGLAFVLLILVGVCLRVGLGYLFSWWADRAEAQADEERRRFEALIGLHERPVNYPPAKGAKGWDGRKTRKSA